MNGLNFRQLFLKPPDAKPVIIDDPGFIPDPGENIKVNEAWFTVGQREFEVIVTGETSTYWACVCFLKCYEGKRQDAS
ncbi:hypothetical protein D0962_22960 [Leptolyngbyaceae cyanobacterium CCMR0082]|uniref:Uncharacterized protein n=1 Tax=Adonisia turfae CCMR0082 TaxID=2304604 RepID=A0A6M0SAU2_9CYAN|nr:hypothetical protein [Adonisia turfae]NEZ65580.1 hypothetical protein [Adonisia turfae CCMR0082]